MNCQNFQLSNSRNDVSINKHSPRSIRTEADAVKCAAQLGFVLRVTLQIAQLVNAMCELALVSVFALASFLEGTTQFRLVAVDVCKQLKTCPSLSSLHTRLTVMRLSEVLVPIGYVLAYDVLCSRRPHQCSGCH